MRLKIQIRDMDDNLLSDFRVDTDEEKVTNALKKVDLESEIEWLATVYGDES
jgi:hypothetical protein